MAKERLSELQKVIVLFCGKLKEKSRDYKKGKIKKVTLFDEIILKQLSESTKLKEAIIKFNRQNKKEARKNEANRINFILVFQSLNKDIYQLEKRITALEKERVNWGLNAITEEESKRVWINDKELNYLKKELYQFKKERWTIYRSLKNLETKKILKIIKNNGDFKKIILTPKGQKIYVLLL